MIIYESSQLTGLSTTIPDQSSNVVRIPLLYSDISTSSSRGSWIYYIVIPYNNMDKMHPTETLEMTFWLHVGCFNPEISNSVLEPLV